MVFTTVRDPGRNVYVSVIPTVTELFCGMVTCCPLPTTLARTVLVWPSVVSVTVYIDPDGMLV